MNKISRAIHDIHFLDDMAARNVWINKIHPLAKLLVTIIYIFVVMSFGTYNISGLVSMITYILAITILSELSFRKMVYRLRIVLAAVCVIGIANPIMDREVLYHMGAVYITTGMVSMISLIMKAMMAVFASYILIETTSIENICYALRKLHVPRMIVTMIMLIYRYIIVLLKETQRVTQAYSIRAPKQKGVGMSAWGSLAGQMLLRSIDRAQIVYESMILRGYNGEYYLKGSVSKGGKSIAYFVVWCMVFIVLRVIPIFEMAGNI